MAVMAPSRMLTRADLDALPQDGLRHELIDGAFVMTPAPGFAHQNFAFALERALHDAAKGRDLVVVHAPFDVILGSNVVEPDILVAPRSVFTERDIPTAPALIVEVRSPSTAWLDEGRKRSLYEQSGVVHYWLADAQAPSITVLELINGRYERTAMATGDEVLTITRPFPITVTPSRLARG